MGVQEALHRGVPMLFIPLLNEHHRLAAHAQKNGNGLVLPFDDLTKETFVEKINQLTTDASYLKQAAAISKIYTDNPITPMDEAIYWMEYAIRTNGAKHLKSSSAYLPCWKYNNIDVVLFFFAIIVGSISFWALVIKLCIQRYKAKEHKGKFKYY